ncbi:MAG TPA: Holliday junction branch migration protein RuvA [Bacteroidales bacterium]|nr:Holliday junction branch migration protein RuvA [Bacteroidales bacterium]
MIVFLEGTIEEKNPAFVVVNCNGIGYGLHISLHTYSKLPDLGKVKILAYQVIREDAHLLFGFADKEERELFKLLISVSGIGPNTARMILSSMNPAELKSAIAHNNISRLQSIKGIGAKSAQRLVVDLRDKIEKEVILKDDFLGFSNNTAQTEALSALVMLGFAKPAAQKVLGAILKQKQGEPISTEDLVKEALKSF